MTSKTKEQIIFENWRKFLDKDISEVSVYKYTGKAVDPDAPEALQVWDPETITKTPTGKFALTGSDIEPLDLPSVTGALGAIWDKGKEIAADYAAPIGVAAAGFFGGRFAINKSINALEKRQTRKAMLKVGKELADKGIDPRKNPRLAKQIIKNATKKGLVSRLLGGPLKLIARTAGPIGVAYTAYEAYKYFKDKPESEQGKPGVLQRFKNFLGVDDGVEKVSALPHTSNDEDALMRMLHAETSWTHSLDEMAGIVQVAINRKQRRRKKTFADVVRPRTSGWNDGSDSYERNYNSASNYYDKPRAKKARDLIKRMLQGERPVGDLGGALNWLHAGKMKRCNADVGTEIGGFYCFDYGVLGMPFGKRRIPSWAIQQGNKTGQLPIGTSKTKPEMIGKMVYSNGSSNNARSIDVYASPSLKQTRSSKAGFGKGNITIIGDSLFDQTYFDKKTKKETITKSIGYYISKAFSGAVNNLAISGAPVWGRRNSIENQYKRIPESTKILVINGGINDIVGLRRGKNVTESAEKLINIINDAASKGIKVVIFPNVVPYERGGNTTEESKSLNSRLKSVSNGKNIIYVGGFENISITDKRKNLHPGEYYQEISEKIIGIIKDLKKDEQ